jgi:hypothetical protein
MVSAELIGRVPFPAGLDEGARPALADETRCDLG